MSPVRTRLWTGLGFAGEEEDPPEAPTFIVGTTEPDQFNTGAGTLVEENGTVRPAPTIVVNGNVTVSAGQTYKDRIINGVVRLGAGATLENCIVRGPASPPTNSQSLVETNHETVASPSIVRHCTIQPQTPSPYLNGVGNRHLRTYRLKVLDCTDDYMCAANGSVGICNIRDEGSYLGPMVQWRPDPANLTNGQPRSHTHNDVVQLHGNNAGAGATQQQKLDDIVFVGTTFDGRLVPDKGTLPVQLDSREHANGITQTQQAGVADQSWITVDSCWFYSGVQSFNGGTTNNTSGGAKVVNSRFQRPGTGDQPPTKSLVINSTMSVRITSGNTYMDNGATVPVAGA